MKSERNTAKHRQDSLVFGSSSMEWKNCAEGIEGKWWKICRPGNNECDKLCLFEERNLFLRI